MLQEEVFKTVGNGFNSFKHATQEAGSGGKCQHVSLVKKEDGLQRVGSFIQGENKLTIIFLPHSILQMHQLV